MIYLVLIAEHAVGTSSNGMLPLCVHFVKRLSNNMLVQNSCQKQEEKDVENEKQRTKIGKHAQEK